MNWVDDVIGPPQRVPKADISSGNLSSTRSGEGLTREMSALKLASVANLQYQLPTPTSHRCSKGEGLTRKCQL